jgi:hypothetical protein
MAKYDWMDSKRYGNIRVLKELKTDSTLDEVSKYRAIWIST